MASFRRVMGPFLRRMHPDLFATEKSLAKVNAAALQRLNLLLDAAELAREPSACAGPAWQRKVRALQGAAGPMSFYLRPDLEERVVSIRLPAHPVLKNFRRIFADLLGIVDVEAAREAFPEECLRGADECDDQEDDLLLEKRRRGKDHGQTDPRPPWARGTRVVDEEKIRESVFDNVAGAGRVRQWAASQAGGASEEGRSRPRRESIKERWARMEALSEKSGYGKAIDRQLLLAESGEVETRESMSAKMKQRLMRIRWAQTRAFSFLEERVVGSKDQELSKMVSEMLRDHDAVLVDGTVSSGIERRGALERIGRVLFEHADDLRIGGYTRSVLWDRGSFQFVITRGKSIRVEYPHGEEGNREGRAIGPNWRIMVGSGASTPELLRHLLGALSTNDALQDEWGVGDFLRKGKPIRRWWWEANESFNVLEDWVRASSAGTDR